MPEGLCKEDLHRCSEPRYSFSKERFDLCFFVSKSARTLLQHKLVLARENVDLRESFEMSDVVIPLYEDTRSKNGSVALVVMLNLARNEGCNASHFAQSAFVPLVLFQPQMIEEERFLIGANKSSASFQRSSVPIAHWKHWVKLRVVLDEFRYDRSIVKVDKHSPHVYFDELHLMRRSLRPMSTNASYPDPKLTIR